MYHLKSLPHSSYLRIIDSYIHDNYAPLLSESKRVLVIVYELCDCTLEEMLRYRIKIAKPWSEKELQSIGFDLLDAIFMLDEE